MCQFTAIKEAQRGLTIVEELGLSPEKSRIAQKHGRPRAPSQKTSYLSVRE